MQDADVTLPLRTPFGFLKSPPKDTPAPRPAPLVILGILQHSNRKAARTGEPIIAVGLHSGGANAVAALVELIQAQTRRKSV